MSRTRRFPSFHATPLALALALGACSDASERPCGPGTKLDPAGSDACVPDLTLRSCAAGTKPDPGGANACVPDGTVICGDGTTYEMTSGTCVPGGACPHGQLLVNGTCTAEVHANAEEAAEPNDATGAGAIPVPAIGAPGYVVHGCIAPHLGEGPFPLSDHDPWTITVSAPTLLDVTAAGVGGLAAGFVITSSLPELQRDGWARVGLNLVDTTSHRQVFLPAAGTYTFGVADSRALANVDTAAGSERACYFATVRQLALPEPTVLASGSETGSLSDGVHVFSVPAVTDGELLFASLVFDSDGVATLGSLVEQRGGAYGQSSVGVATAMVLGGTAASDRIAFVVDSVQNFALAPVGFTFTLDTRDVAPLPSAGQAATVAAGDGVLDDLRDLTYFWLDVDAGDVVDLGLGFDDDANFMILDSALLTGFSGTAQAIAGFPGVSLDDAAQTTSFRGSYYFPSAGRFYVAVYDPDLAPGTTTRMTSTYSRGPAAPISLGGIVTDHPLRAGNSEWLLLDTSAQPWFEVIAIGALIAGDLQLDYFPTQSGGLVGVDLPETFGQTFSAAGGDRRARIPFEPPTYLVRVSQTGGNPVAGARFSFAAAAQTFVDLGAIDASTSPVDRLGEDFGAVGGSKLYYIRGLDTDALKLTIHPAAPGLRLTVDWLDPNQGVFGTATAETPGADVTLETTPSGVGYVAFRVSGAGATTGYDVHVTFDGVAQ